MEIDEIISYHDVVVKENFGARFNDLTFHLSAVVLTKAERRHAAIAPACNRDRMEPEGISDIEGKVARVATSKLGNERVSNLADELHWCSSVFGCRNACGPEDVTVTVDVDPYQLLLLIGSTSYQMESFALSGVEWVDDIIQAFGTGAKLYGGSH